MANTTRSLASYLLLSLLFGAILTNSSDAWLFGLWKPRKPTIKPPRYTLVVFPFDQGNAAGLPEGFGEVVASDIRTMLAHSAYYSPFLYTSRLAPVQRAKEDNVLKSTDIEPPFAEDRAKALKLAQLLATDYYLVGEIDSYQFDRTNRIVEITLKADLFDGKTGKLLKTLLITGRTPESVSGGDEDELRDIAKGVAVTKLIAELSSTPPGTTTRPSITPSEANKPVESSTPAPLTPESATEAKRTAK
ncbi:MAG: hypothetical protein ACUVT8_05875 [Armatimonadota bacterium]